jgi:hypothetical protein
MMKSRKKRPHLKKKNAVSSKQLTMPLCHKSIKTTAKLHELGYEMLQHNCETKIEFTYSKMFLLHSDTLSQPFD